ncbi:MAG: DNA helicase RecQ [Bacteroidia bacterium]|nr:DNA helicase RecQ [Bacteroidia bacterium]
MIAEAPVKKKNLESTLKSFFGFDKFKGRQKEIIENILSGKHTFVIMPTGGGKSLCYQLPAILSEGTAIVVSPLIALMKNQVDSIRGFSDEPGIAHFLNSSLNKSEIQKVKKDVISGKTKLLYVAPETLTKGDNLSFFKDFKISFFAIDEAHCISEWGHDFRPEYRRIRSLVDSIDPQIPIMALTATATPKVQTDIQKNLGMDDAVVFKSSFNRPNLYYEIRAKSKNVDKEIIKYIRKNPGKSGIIYCLSRKKVEELAELLKVNNIKAEPYHAGMDAKDRSRIQDLFLMEEIDVIVATIAFGMGIDKPDVRYVIHYDIPKSLEGYYQETGRAGRDGGEGNCITFYSFDDIVKLEKFMKDKPVSEQEIGKQMLQETAAFAETASCRRKYLLHYFGEEFDEKDCNNMCDNCRYPKQKFDATDDLKLVLKAVLEMKEKHKIRDVINVLLGIKTSTVKNYKHDKLSVWEAGLEDEEKNEHFWQSVLRQALVNGFLYKDIENYGLLKVSEKGHDFLKKPYQVMFHVDRNMEEEAESEEDIIFASKTAGGGALDQDLYNLLKDLVKKIAKSKNLPPYVIFQDTSLEEMATQYPITMDELTKISGVGAGKAAKYGKPFIELIKNYVEENEIERPSDFQVKSVVNKSANKVDIIRFVDKKVDFDTIARNKNLTMDELLTEMESIVKSGTKLNISYYINSLIEKNIQDEVREFFRKSEKDDIEEAIREFGSELSVEELRMMRIQFYNDFAN